MNGRVLLIGGSDPGGGAGIQADTKTVTALGGYAATAITALTVQDTRAVYEIMALPAALVLRQLRAVLEDIGADCLKTGMLVNADVVDALCDELSGRYPDIPLVVDPVMAAKDGRCLLDREGCAALKDRLIPRAAVLTPNVPEAEYLTGLSVTKLAQVSAAAKILLGLGAGAVLITGGHLAGEHVSDVLLTKGEELVFTAPRIPTRHTHGTGCTLASAIAAGIAQGFPLISAVERAKAYVLHVLRHAPGLGRGQGPLGHAHPWKARQERKFPRSGGPRNPP